MDNQDFQARYLNDSPGQANAAEDKSGIEDVQEAVIAEPVVQPEPDVSNVAARIDEPTIVRPRSASESEVIERHRRDTSPPVVNGRLPNGTGPQGYSNEQQRRDYQQPQYQQESPANGRGNHHAANTGGWQARQPFENPPGVAVARPGTEQESAAPLRVASSWAFGADGRLDPAWAGE